MSSRRGPQGSWTLRPITQPVTSLTGREKDTRSQLTRFQSAVISCFDGVGVGVGEGALQMGSGLALRVVHKYEAIFFIKTELVRPASGVIGAAVRTPRGSGSAGSCPGPVAGAAGLAGCFLRLLADARLLCFRIGTVFILGLLPWVKHKKGRWQTHQLDFGPVCFSPIGESHNNNTFSQVFLVRLQTFKK